MRLWKLTVRWRIDCGGSPSPEPGGGLWRRSSRGDPTEPKRWTGGGEENKGGSSTVRSNVGEKEMREKRERAQWFRKGKREGRKSMRDFL